MTILVPQPRKWVLAIDPGTSKSAFVCWTGQKVHGFGVETNEMMESVLHLTECDVYCEWVSSYGMRVGAEVFETCYWVGRFAKACVQPFQRVPRMEVKRWHTGRGSTKDADVRGALIEKYGPPGLKANPGLTYGLTSHTWQAFALATYVTEGGLK